jgi:hypothetical protein
VLLLVWRLLQNTGSINDDTPDVEAGDGGAYVDYFSNVTLVKEQLKALQRYLDDIKRLQQSQLWNADTEGSGTLLATTTTTTTNR